RSASLRIDSVSSPSSWTSARASETTRRRLRPASFSFSLAILTLLGVTWPPSDPNAVRVIEEKNDAGKSSGEVAVQGPGDGRTGGALVREGAQLGKPDRGISEAGSAAD